MQLFVSFLCPPDLCSSFVVDLRTGAALPASVDVFSAMAQKWYLESWKFAEKVSRTEETRMLNYAGEILLAITLVLSSFLFYWLVWTLNGLGKIPEPQSITKQERRAKWAE
jgi:hypothetical protein